jgi:sortase (surface protein transpeptidase)
MDRIRSRRLFIRAALIAPAALAIGQTVRAAESPSSGCGRPGPACAVTTPPRQSRGPKPMAIMIPDAEVDAPIEVCEIVDGVMSAPSGPWVVGWYRESGHLGEADNVVLAGHLDYWGVGKAVFYHVGSLKKDDDIQVIGDDNQQYPFKVEWVRKIDMTKTGADGIRQIVGKTADERLTLITCGGDFDSVTGEYKERIVVRAIPVQ